MTREVVSFAAGTHMPRPGQLAGPFRRCLDCLGLLRSYVTRNGHRSWRHYRRAI